MQTEHVIYVELLNEGVRVWRPVRAQPLGQERYRLAASTDPDEHWAFPPGSIVRVERRPLAGCLELVAVAVA